MSWWPNSGRYSPFTSFYGRQSRDAGPPRINEDDYSYITGHDGASDSYREAPRKEPQPQQAQGYGFSNLFGFSPRATPAPSAEHGARDHHHNSSSHHTHHQHARPGSSSSLRHSELAGADLEPDTIHLKYKGKSFSLHFKPYSIAEGRLLVGDLRKYAAEKLAITDPRRLKLLYKREQLRDMQASCAAEGLKQNSEVTCVVSNDPISSDSDEDNDTGGDSSSAAQAESGTPAGGPKKKRKGHRGKGKRTTDTDTSNPHHSATPRAEHLGQHAHLTPPVSSSASRQPSPSAGNPPATPGEMLDALQNKLNLEFAPLVAKFLRDPPAAEKDRQFEYKRLSESILQQVVLKLDGIEAAGDETLRLRRKALIKEAQKVLSDLDAVGKK